MKNTDGKKKTARLDTCFFYAFLILSLFVVVVWLVLWIIVVLYRVKPENFLAGAYHWLMRSKPRLVNLEGIGDVAAAIGLTGALFAWLLQIIDKRECGVSLDKLYDYEFKGYQERILCFILVAGICIYIGNMPGSRIAYAVVSLTFITMALELFQMWEMCKHFLFSAKERRRIAFRYLEENMMSSPDSDWYDIFHRKWASELARCCEDGEKGYIQDYIRLISAKWSQESSDEKAGKYKRCLQMAWESLGIDNWWVLYKDILLLGDLVMLAGYVVQPLADYDPNNPRKSYDLILKNLSNIEERGWPISLEMLAYHTCFGVLHQNVVDADASIYFDRIILYERDEGQKPNADTVLQFMTKAYALQYASSTDNLEIKKTELRKELDLKLAML